MRVTAFWGRRRRRERVAELLGCVRMVRPSPSLEELIEAVDAVIVGDRHGDLHLPHALPFLAAGRPVCSSTSRSRVRSPMRKRSLLPRNGPARRCSRAVRSAGRRDKGDAEGAARRLNAPLEHAAPTARGTRRANTAARSSMPSTRSSWRRNWSARDWTDVASDAWREPDRALSRSTASTTSARASAARASRDRRHFGVAHPIARGLSIDAADPLADDYMAPVVDRDRRACCTAAPSPMSREALLAPVALMAEIDALLREPPSRRRPRRRGRRHRGRRSAQSPARDQSVK